MDLQVDPKVFDHQNGVSVEAEFYDGTRFKKDYVGKKKLISTFLSSLFIAKLFGSFNMSVLSHFSFLYHATKSATNTDISMGKI